MTKEEILKWLRHNKPRLSISAISKETGVNNLSKIINGDTNSTGYAFTLPDKYLSSLEKVIRDMSAINEHVDSSPNQY